MKIGYFVEYFPYANLLDNVDYFKKYHHGGTETVAYNLAMCMAQRGHEVHVFTTSYNANNSIEKYRNIIIHRYVTNFKVGTANFSLNIFRKPLKYPLDIVHAHANYPPADLAALFYAKRKKIPMVVTLHGLPDESYGHFFRKLLTFFYSKYLLNKLLCTAEFVISPSNGLVNESKNLSNIGDKVIVIPNGINLADYEISYTLEECRNILKLPLDKEIILYLGALAPYKGVDVLIQSMPKIIKEIPDVKLIVAGDGEMRGTLKNLAKILTVERYIDFVGFVKESLKPFYYKASNIFILPSISRLEAFGIVNLEAMACSKPVIASRITGIPEIVENGKNGVLVPPRDSKALANAIIKLLGNRDLASRMGVNGRKVVEEKYTWERVAKMTEKVYEEII